MTQLQRPRRETPRVITLHDDALHTHKHKHSLNAAQHVHSLHGRFDGCASTETEAPHERSGVLCVLCVLCESRCAPQACLKNLSTYTPVPCGALPLPAPRGAWEALGRSARTVAGVEVLALHKMALLKTHPGFKQTRSHREKPATIVCKRCGQRNRRCRCGAWPCWPAPSGQGGQNRGTCPG